MKRRSQPKSSSTSLESATLHSQRASRAHHIRALDTVLSTPNNIDLLRLRELSVKGFEDDQHRRKIWPLLLGVDVEGMDEQAEKCRQAAATAAASGSIAASSTSVPAFPAEPFVSSFISSSSSSSCATPAPYDYFTGVIYSHKYFDQIEKDINRSMFHFDVTRAFKEKKRAASRQALARIIHTIFSLHSELHYIQGFHDIASVFLLVCHDTSDPSQPFGQPANARGEELAFRLTERLALLHIRDSLRPSLDTVVEVLSLIFPLLRVADPEVHDFLLRTNVQSFFTLSWILTWFSHNLERYQDICRVFDFFLSSHPLMPLYSTVALIIQLRDGLLALRFAAIKSFRTRNYLSLTQPPLGSLPADEEVEVDLSAVHEYFQKLPPILNLDQLFASTQKLYDRYPPVELIMKGKLKIPLDSPLLLSSSTKKGESDDAGGLSKKVGHYLAWKRKERERMMKDGTWGKSTSSTSSSSSSSSPSSSSRRKSTSTSSASSTSSHSFYGYPASTSRLYFFYGRRRQVWLFAFISIVLIGLTAALVMSRPGMMTFLMKSSTTTDANESTTAPAPMITNERDAPTP